VNQADPRTQSLPGGGGKRPGLLAEQFEFTLVGLERGGQKAQQRGLARPGWPDDRNPFTSGDLQIDPAQRNLTAGVGVPHAGQLHHWLGFGGAVWPWRRLQSAHVRETAQRHFSSPASPCGFFDAGRSFLPAWFSMKRLAACRSKDRLCAQGLAGARGRGTLP